MKKAGIITPIITPFYDEGNINFQSMEQQIDRLINSGIDGIFALGTNGEAYALNFDEKVEVINRTVKKVNKRVPVYIGTGCVTTDETIELSIIAENIGADYLSLITPNFGGLSQDEIYQHFKQVAEVVRTPIILYNIPSRTGNFISQETLYKLCEIENILGIKDSSGDFINTLNYLEVKEKREDFIVLAGNDSLILSTLMFNGDGAVSGCSNVYPITVSDIFNNFVKNNIEKALLKQNEITNYRKLFKYGNSNKIIKETMNQIGFEVGICRSPFNMITSQVKEEVSNFLKRNQTLN